MNVLQTSSTPLPPFVHFVEGRPTTFIDDGDAGWRRCSLEQQAYLRTGVTGEPRESNVGVYVRRRQNGRFLLGFDLWRLPVRLRQDVVDGLYERWKAEITRLSKPIHNRIRFRGGRTSFELETMSENVEGWKRELEAVLSSEASYESIEHRPTNV